MVKRVILKCLNEERVLNLENNFLTLSTVKSAFLLPADTIIGAYYKNEEEPIWCLLSKDGTEILLPDDLKNITLFIESNKPPSRPVAPQGTGGLSPLPKRPRTPVMDRLYLPTEDKDEDGSCVRILTCCQKYIFYSTFLCMKKCGDKKAIYSENAFVLTVVSRHYVVTAAHCLTRNVAQLEQFRRQIKKHDCIVIKSTVDDSTHTVELMELCISEDFALLRLVGDGEFKCPFLIKPNTACFRVGKSAICLGLPAIEKKRDDCLKLLVEISVPHNEVVPFKVRISAIGVPETMMFTVNCGLHHGFSGGGFFACEYGFDYLLGICNRGRIPPTTYGEFCSESGYRSTGYAYACSAFYIHHKIDKLTSETEPQIETTRILRAHSSPPEGPSEKRSRN